MCTVVNCILELSVALAAASQSLAVVMRTEAAGAPLCLPLLWWKNCWNEMAVEVPWDRGDVLVPLSTLLYGEKGY